MNDRHIVVIVPRGEVIRNFVYTGALDDIAKESEVSLISITPGTAVDSELRSRFRNVYPLEGHGDEPWLVDIQREILDISHNRWLWSQAAQHRWNLRDIEAATWQKRTKRIIKKALGMPFASRRGLDLLGKLERMSSRALGSANGYVDLYERIKPTLVFNGSHVHSAIATQAVQAAQWSGIPTATFIFSWDNLTSQGRIMLPYDYFLVWNEDLKKQLLEIYDWISPEQVFVTGTPQFDFHFRPEFEWTREQFCEVIGADPGRPIVLYSTGMANHMPEEPKIVEELADILKEVDVGGGKPQLLVRVYPKDMTGRFDELMRQRPDILFPAVEWEPAWLTPRYNDSFALANCLRHCALGINIASTVSLELCMFDKPVINIGYNPPGVDERIISFSKYYEFDHYKPVVESGAVEVARDREELKALVETHLAGPALKSRERKALITKMFGNTLDGGSSRRVSELLLRLAEPCANTK